MKVKELIELLSTFSEDLEVLDNRYSDYQIMEWQAEVIKAVPKGQWVMRSHPTMSPENKSKEQTYLLFTTGGLGL